MTGCDGGCTWYETDRSACGACGNICDPQTTCAGGSCVPCARSVCGNRCVDRLDDALNCGSCGHSCLGGNCAFGVCSAYTFQTGVSEIASNGAVLVALMPSGAVIIGADGGRGFAPVATAPSGLALTPDEAIVSANAVLAIALDGGRIRTIAPFPAPADAIATDGAMVVWTSNGAVLSAPMDGGVATQRASGIVYAGRIAMLAGTAYVLSAGTTAQSGALFQVPLDGGAVHAIATGLATPIGITAIGDAIAWTSSDGAVTRWSPGGGSSTIQRGFSLPAGIAFDGTWIFVTDARAGTITQIDPASGATTSVASAECSPGSIAAAPFAIAWIASGALRILAR